jgi:hypothetical protein
VLVIDDILHSAPRDLKLLRRGLLRLLDELVQKDNPPAHHGAVEDPRDPFGSLDPKLEQSAAHCSRVRHSKVRTVDLHSLGVLQEACDEAAGKGEDFVLNPPTMEGDGPGQRFTIAYSLYRKPHLGWPWTESVV